MINLNVKYFTKYLYFLCSFLLFSHTAIAMKTTYPIMLESSRSSLLNKDNINKEDEIKVIFVNKNENSNSTTSIYINMDKKKLASSFALYDENSCPENNEIVVESKWEEVSPEIMARCFECCFISKDSKTTNGNLSVCSLVEKIASSFNEEVDQWTRVTRLLDVINFMIKNEYEQKQDFLSSILYLVGCSKIDFSNDENLHKLTAFMTIFLRFPSKLMTSRLRNDIECYFRALSNKAKAANYFICFKDKLSCLFDEFPEVLNGTSKYMLISNLHDYDDIGQLITDEIKEIFVFLESNGIIDLTMVAAENVSSLSINIYSPTTLFISHEDIDSMDSMEENKNFILREIIRRVHIDHSVHSSAVPATDIRLEATAMLQATHLGSKRHQTPKASSKVCELEKDSDATALAGHGVKNNAGIAVYSLHLPSICFIPCKKEEESSFNLFATNKLGTDIVRINPYVFKASENHSNLAKNIASTGNIRVNSNVENNTTINVENNTTIIVNRTINTRKDGKLTTSDSEENLDSVKYNKPEESKLNSKFGIHAIRNESNRHDIRCSTSKMTQKMTQSKGLPIKFSRCEGSTPFDGSYH